MVVLMFKNAFVVGCGSIGTKHALELASYSESVVLIDPFKNENIQMLVARDPQKFSYIDSIEGVIGEFHESDLAVVSNWAPDHFETVKSLIKRKIRFLIIEKPAFVSVNQIDTFLRIVPENCKVLVNQANSWNFEAREIIEISKSLDLGDVQSVSVFAGAKCLSTNGSHAIHFASELFKAQPEVVSGVGRAIKINPRATHLDYIEGVFGFRFAGPRWLSLNYSNSSSVDNPIEILWRDAIGFYESGKIQINRRAQDTPTLPITRYGAANQSAYQGPLGVDLANENHFQRIYNAIVGIDLSDSRDELKKHLGSNAWMLKAMISMESGRAVRSEEKLLPEFEFKEFDIS
jgi:predicted dehydrogenase